MARKKNPIARSLSLGQHQPQVIDDKRRLVRNLDDPRYRSTVKPKGVSEPAWTAAQLDALRLGYGFWE